MTRIKEIHVRIVIFCIAVYVAKQFLSATATTAAATLTQTPGEAGGFEAWR